MASSKRTVTSYFPPVSKHVDSSLKHSKSQVLLAKRGRCDPEDGTVASSFTCPVTQTHPSATHDPAVVSQSHVECKLHVLSKTEPNHDADKKVKFEAEPMEMTKSTAYLQMSSGGRLLQSHEHRPLLSDKDYASSLCTPSASLTAVVPPPVPLRACRSPQFAEDDKDILEMKLNRTESSVGAESRQDDLDAALLLPKAFLDLEVIFELVIKILATAHVRGGKRGTPLENLKDDMSRLYKRSLRKEHLKQILALVPDCLIVSHAFLDGKFCHRTVSINTSKMNLRPGEQIIHEKFLKDMKSSLRQSNLSFLRARHTEFLQTHHPHLKLDPERISQWHADFDLSAVHLPIIDLPPLPQAQASTATSNVEEKAVKITPEIQKAFEKYQAETMTPAKLKHIRDCSKSEIGKQNIEKLQNFELNQFALQQTFKVADEKNAESKFRTAADALRCLFRQRSKPSLPVADVLKVLQQSRGLTFKSNLDAMDMVNDIVDKLPNFFSKKKFPTHGEMIMFSSSELFPWHQPRAYPQTKQ